MKQTQKMNKIFKMKNNKVEIFFRTRNYCSINVPKNIKKKKEIRDFIIDKLINNDFENFVNEWFDFEIENFEIIE